MNKTKTRDTNVKTETKRFLFVIVTPRDRNLVLKDFQVDLINSLQKSALFDTNVCPSVCLIHKQ
jgi:hypothetical protein